jgi:hypothetical protein
MADILVDGNVKVVFAPTISNINAPTAAELNAGTPLSPFMPIDGLQNFKATTAKVDNTGLESTVDTNTIGRDSYGDSTVRLKKQTGTDTVYNTLIRTATGFIVVRRWLSASTAWATGQAVQVYPVICGQIGYVDVDRNTMDRYDIPTVINSPPALRAAVA